MVAVTTLDVICMLYEATPIKAYIVSPCLWLGNINFPIILNWNYIEKQFTACVYFYKPSYDKRKIESVKLHATYRQKPFCYRIASIWFTFPQYRLQYRCRDALENSKFWAIEWLERLTAINFSVIFNKIEFPLVLWTKHVINRNPSELIEI